MAPLLCAQHTTPSSKYPQDWEACHSTIASRARCDYRKAHRHGASQGIHRPGSQEDAYLVFPDKQGFNLWSGGSPVMQLWDSSMP